MTSARSAAPAHRSAQEPAGDRRSAQLLERLEQAHATLLAAMDALDRITRLPLADRSRYTAARSRLSDASFARRKLLNECFQHLHPIVEPVTAQALEALSRDNLEALGHSAAHVARWPADAIEREWHAYCRASRDIRARMAAAIEEDRRLLCPILRLQASRSGREA